MRPPWKPSEMHGMLCGALEISGNRSQGSKGPFDSRRDSVDRGAEKFVGPPLARHGSVDQIDRQLNRPSGRTQGAAQAAHGTIIKACYFCALSSQSRIAESVVGFAAGSERSLAWGPGHGPASQRGVMVATDGSTPALDYKLDVLRKASGLLRGACCHAPGTARPSHPGPTKPAPAEMADHDQSGRGGLQPAGLGYRVLDHSPWCAACVPRRCSGLGLPCVRRLGGGGSALPCRHAPPLHAGAVR